MEFNPLEHETPQEDLQGLINLVSDLRARKGEPISVVEIGTWVGGTAITMADAFPGDVVVYCIDAFEGNVNDRLGQVAKKYSPWEIYSILLQNLGPRFLRTVIPCIGTSAFYHKIWDMPVDMVFIDGDHRFEFVLDDIMGWLPKIRPGGFICGHDFDVFTGVSAAVNHAMAKGMIQEAALVGRTIWASQIKGAYPNEVRPDDSAVPVRQSGSSSSGDVAGENGRQLERKSKDSGDPSHGDRRNSDNDVKKPVRKRSTRKRRRPVADD